MEEQLYDLLKGLEDVKLIVKEYKQFEEENKLTDYQKGFLDGYEHMRLINNLIGKLEKL